ncbi:MAG: RHS repeat-associated core domain-containing protein, partial [Methylotenera sp.]|nr:RHS repeat-associated core domain-containing protein [Methylotenera sp.]
GCYYYRARYYCQDIGRFISEDPLGFQAGINFYAYVDNNPVNANDPSGKDAYLGAKPIDAPSILTNNAYHTVLVLMPNNPQDFANRSGWQTLSNGQIISTLSGQPKDGFSVATLTGQSKLNYTPNFPKDQIQNLTELQRISTPKGMTDTQFISGLIQTAGSYQNNVQYNLVPEKQGGYNSNSFTAGVISKAGGTPPTINYSAPGYSKPLPISNGANGGFLLYPNKSNNNYTQSVYSK